MEDHVLPPVLLPTLRPSLHSRVQICGAEKIIERPVQAELLPNITQVARLPVAQPNKLPAKPDVLSAHQLWTLIHVKLAHSVSCATSTGSKVHTIRRTSNSLQTR